MACTSTVRRTGRPGWFCTGDDLMQVGTVWYQGRHLPVVAPAARLDEVRELPWTDEPVPYTGKGDHLHASLVDTGLRQKIEALIAGYSDERHGPDAADFMGALHKVLTGELDPRTEPIPID